MIQLPDNWRDTIRVIPDTHLLLAYVNAHREFFMYMHPIDKALGFDDQVEALGNAYPGGRAHTINQDLTTNWLAEPSDQEWVPMPMADTRAISLEAYRAHMKLAGKEDEAARRAQQEADAKSDQH